MITYHPELFGFQTNTIDNNELFDRCLEIESVLPDECPPVPVMWQGSKTTALHNHYNLFTFPIKELNQLYKLLVDNITPLLEPETTYMIKSWMNVYHKGENIDWHGHALPHNRVWHGFYCVHAGESATDYRMADGTEINVPSREGLIVIGRSNGDLHKSSEWSGDKPRVTLAFDISPIESINFKINHYIPFKE
jgi:hypothetical protein